MCSVNGSQAHSLKGLLEEGVQGAKLSTQVPHGKPSTGSGRRSLTHGHQLGAGRAAVQSTPVGLPIQTGSS